MAISADDATQEMDKLLEARDVTRVDFDLDGAGIRATMYDDRRMLCDGSGPNASDAFVAAHAAYVALGRRRRIGF